MKTSVMMYGEPEEVANELCSCNEPEEVQHVDLIAALGNALNRIARLERQNEGLANALKRATARIASVGNESSCLANGITPD